ncbi:MAG: T9SS type A sorting domain-containing protein, partial [Bacteroidetes bacterium]|nr:T9SS type A sorting domain-containing protein [Bacteroidota bacterium]
LEQNYPNPFNPSTTIRYSIPEARNHSAIAVTLKVYDLLGKETATLVNEVQEAGNYSVQFNASQLSSGIYFYTLTAGNNISTKKLLLLK